ncbi:hypothetical protein D3C79_1105440 [compost metagenome]
MRYCSSYLTGSSKQRFGRLQLTMCSTDRILSWLDKAAQLSRQPMQIILRRCG